MCSLQRNYDVIRNWERFETGPLTVYKRSTIYLIETPFNAFANRADPGSTMFAYGNMIYLILHQWT